MREVKKSKSKKQTKKIEIEEIEDKELDLEEVAGEVVEEAEEEEEEKVKAPKKEERAKKGEKKSPEKPKKEKKSKKGLVAFLMILVILAGGAFVAKKFLTKTTVKTETVKLADNARGFSNYFKEYLLDRLRAEELFNYTYKELPSETVLKKLATLKDGFSKVSRGMSGYSKSGFKELAEVMKSDADEYLPVVRELRAVMTGGLSKEERMAEFEKIAEAFKEKLRSAVYVARAAFKSDVAGFSSKGILAFKGKAVVEVGGGVANILVGNTKEQILAVSSDTLEKDVKAIDAQKLYGYTSARVFEIGKSLKETVEGGWFKNVKADVGSSAVTIETTRISVILKNVQGMNEELKEQGIQGLLETEEKTVAENIEEAIVGIKGKK